jgi:hypothetical protein
MIYKKVRQATQKLVSIKEDKVLSQLHNLPFWIWGDKKEHEQIYHTTEGKCCFNHMLPAGCPSKDGIIRPIYDWQKQVYDALFANDDGRPNYQAQHCAWLAARGIGKSELGLRIMAWLVCKDIKLAGTHMAIIPGNRIELGQELLLRFKRLFFNKETGEGIIFNESRKEELQLNGVTLSCWPSHHPDALRGLTSLSFALVDECGAWPLSEQEDVLDVLLGYIQKSSNFHILMLSTAGYPNDMLDKIFKMSEMETIFKRVRTDWRVGYLTIFSEDDISKSKMAVNTFMREMELIHAGFQGNVYPEHIISQCVNDYNLNRIDVDFGNFSLGVDLGSTVTGITLLQWNQADKKVYVILSDEHVNLEYNRILRKVNQLINTFSPDKIYVDASNSFLIRDLKHQFYEEPFEIMKKRITEEYKDQGMKDRPYETCEKYMKIIPIPWNKEGVPMIQHSKYVMERNQLRINPIFDKLITSLRTAYSEHDKLNKDLTLHNDCYDSFILALRRYRK